MLAALAATMADSSPIASPNNSSASPSSRSPARRRNCRSRKGEFASRGATRRVSLHVERVDVLGPDADANQPGRDAAQHGKKPEELEQQRRLRPPLPLQHAADDPFLNGATFRSRLCLSTVKWFNPTKGY